MPLDFGLAKMAPSQISYDFTSTAPEGFVFGFNASRLRIVNDRASAVFVVLGSTVGSTAGIRTCAGETLIDGIVPLCGAISVASTTTSTAPVRVAAWGG